MSELVNDENATRQPGSNESLSFAQASAARHAALKDKWSSARGKDVVEEETAGNFWRTFGPALAEARRRTEEATKLDEVVALEVECTELGARAAAASSFLTAFDVKRATGDLKALREAVGAKRSSVAPRKKFGFKKKSLFAKAAPEATVVADRSREVVSTAESSVPAAPGFRGKAGEVLVFDDATADELHLEDLEECVVLCAKPLLTLRLLNVRRCHVFAAGVSGPCYCIKASDCVLRAAPRQLRIHDTHRTTFHVAMASGPIVEDCDGVRFAPYAATWDGTRPAFDAAKPATDFVVDPDAWKDVKDFKWLKADQSPHWSLLARDDFAAAVPEKAAAEAAALGLALITPPETPEHARRPPL